MNLHAVLATPMLVFLGLLSSEEGRPAPPHAGVEDRVARRLVAHGFENVAVVAHTETLSVWYENRIYRNELTALGAAAALSAAEIHASKRLVMIPQNLGVPLLSISARAGDWIDFLLGARTPPWFQQRVQIDTDNTPRPFYRSLASARSHSSHWKLDLTVRPLLAFEFGIANDPFQYALHIAPEATMSPLTGVLLTSQVSILVKDDMNPYARGVSPGRLTLSWAGWLPKSWLFAASAGYFSGNRYGVVVQTGRYLFDGSLELSFGGDVSGLLEFYDGITLYSGISRWSLAVAATHRTRGIDLETTVTAARFMEGAFGTQLDVLRRYGEFELGFFGILTADHMVAGVQMQLPLPTERLPNPSRIRLTGISSFPIRYQDSLNNVGLRVRHFNDLDWLREGLDPTYVLNNIEHLRRALAYLNLGAQVQ